jgi:hypothetical protein
MRPATSIWLLAALVACQAQPAGVTQTEWELIQRWVTCGHCIGPPDALSAEALRDSVAGLGPRAISVIADLADGLPDDRLAVLGQGLDAREAENFDAMIRKRAALSLYDLRAEQELQNALAAAQTLGRPDVIAVIQAQLDVLLGVAPPNTIQIDPPAQGIPVGESFQFQAFVRDSQGNLLQETLTWSSNNTAVATVVAGRVSGLTVGATTITASVPGTSATADVSVIPTPRRLSLMGGNLQGTSVGQALSQPLAVRLQDSTGTALSGVGEVWP